MSQFALDVEGNRAPSSRAPDGHHNGAAAGAAFAIADNALSVVIPQ